MIPSEREFWRTLCPTPGDPKRTFPLRLCPLLLFVNANSETLADLKLGSPRWQSAKALEDPLILAIFAATGKGLALSTSDRSQLHRQLALEALEALQADLRADLTLVACKTLPDDKATEARVNDLVRRLNESAESIVWTLQELWPQQYDNVGAENINDMTEDERLELKRSIVAIKAREAKVVKKHPEHFGRLAKLPFTERYGITEILRQRAPGLRNFFYFMLADIVRGTLIRPRLCNEPTCGQFFLCQDQREKYCSSECSDQYHGRTASTRSMLSRAKKETIEKGSSRRRR